MFPRGTHSKKKKKKSEQLKPIVAKEPKVGEWLPSQRRNAIQFYLQFPEAPGGTLLHKENI